MRSFLQLLLIQIVIYIQIILSQQQQTCTSQSDPSTCCNSSCSTCSAEKLSECTKCNSSYFYLSNKYQCLQTCPQGTYTVTETNSCKSCSTVNCNQCSDSTCLQCKSGFFNDPFDTKNCISNCSKQGQVLDDQGVCNFGCSNDAIYDVDHSSNSCITKQSCPSLQKIPALVSKADLVSTIIGSTQQLITAVDRLGNVILYSYPELVEQLGYTISLTAQTIVDCKYVDDNSLKNDVIYCLTTPFSIIQFKSSDGTLINKIAINDRTYVISFQSQRNWNLLVGLKDKYEVLMIDYINGTSTLIDSYTTLNIIAKRVKQSVNPTSSSGIDIMIYNQSDGTLNYYKQSPSVTKKILYTYTGANASKAQIEQLNSYSYWIIYQANSFQLLQLDNNLNLTLMQTVSIDDTISSIKLTSNSYDLIFIVNPTSMSLKLFKLNESKGMISAGNSNNLNLLLKSVNQIYQPAQDSDIFVVCSSSNTSAYQLTNYNTELKFLTKLKQNNPLLCNLQTFQVQKLGQSIHIWETLQRNFDVNIVDNANKIKTSYIVGYFADSDQVKSKLTDRVQYNTLLVENSEKQLVIEYKSFGLSFWYSINSKKIVNQVRYWYPYNELVTQLFFNSVQIDNNLYLFVGFELNTFKIKFIDLKTSEITYEQEIPEIATYYPNFDDFNAVQYPVYFQGSDSIIVQIIRKKLITDKQKRYDFFFIQKNKDPNSPNRYKLYYPIVNFSAFNFLYSIQSEYLFIFDLKATQTYSCYIYNINGVRVYESANYVFRDPNRFGQVNEAAKIAYIFGYTQLLKVDLKTLVVTIELYTGQCNQTYMFNPDFTRVYLQDTCGAKGEGIFIYPGMTILNQQTQKNSVLYAYQYYGNQLVFKSFSSNLLMYDVATNILFKQTSVNGNNSGGMMQDNQAIFFNAQALVHYDISTQKLLFVEDSVIPYTFTLQPKKLRFNYAISNKQNMFQVKRYNELLLASLIQEQTIVQLQFGYIQELNYAALMSQSFIKIFHMITNKLLKTINISIATREFKTYYVTQEIFVNKQFYYQPSNIIVMIYYTSLVCINASTLELAYFYQYQNEIQAFKSIVVDMDLGFIISTNQDYDCVFNMKTLIRNCYKEVDTYIGMPNQPLNDYTQELFYIKKSKLVIICQMISIRLFSLSDFKYKKSIYDTNLDAAQFFYNPYFNYIIFSTKNALVFMQFDLATMTKKQLSLPAPSKDFQSINYRFEFLSDQQNYIFINSNFLAVQIYNQQTHVLQSSIQLDTAFYPFSQWVVDQNRKLIFLIDTNNAVQQISYETNKVLFKYQLDTGADFSVLAVDRKLIWDTYKQKMIVCANKSVYMISVNKNMIDFYFNSTDLILQASLIQQKNILRIQSYQSVNLIDYDYYVNDNKQVFPNQIQPRYYQVNDNIVFHLNDINSQANLFINNKLKATWIRNNLACGYIRMAENDLSNLLVYGIFDKELVIFDLNTSDTISIDQAYLSSNIIGILYEDQDNVFLHSQSQQILQIPKRVKTIQINEVIKVPQGIAQYFFTKNSMQILFTDYKTDTSINVVNISLINGKLQGTLAPQIIMPSRIVFISNLSDSIVIILLETSLISYNYDLRQIVNQYALPSLHVFSNIQIDFKFNRIFVQNKLTGSLVFDFNLNYITSINTFSNNIQFDQQFIYSITSHSANIYFRKDLTYILTFRNFDMTFSLKKITYLGIGYIFLVEFLSKMSIYELSPFVSEPLEKAFVFINQFNVIKFNLLKMNNDINDNNYEFTMAGITLEGIFTYDLTFDLYNQEMTKTCSWSYPLQQQIYQETNIFNQLRQYLTSQKRTLSRLTVQITLGQSLRLPTLSSDIINSNFDLTVLGAQDYEKVYLLTQLNGLSNISYLKLKRMEIQLHPAQYEAFVGQKIPPQNIEINKTLFANLKQFMIEDIKLNEAKINVQDISTVIIKSVVFTHKQLDSTNINIPSLTQIKIARASSVIISSLQIDTCNFNLLQPLLDIEQVTSVVITKIIVSNCQYLTIDSIFSFQNVQNLQIGDLILEQVTLTESTFFQASAITNFSIENLQISQINYISTTKSSQKRLLLAQEQAKIIFDLSEMENIAINKLQIENFESNSLIKILIFSLKHITTKFLLNQTFINNVSFIDISQSGRIFSLTGINESYINQIQVINLNYIQLLVLEEYKLSKMYSYSSNKMEINKATIINCLIYQNNLIDISSFVTIIVDLNINNIKQETTSLKQVSPIIITSTDQVTLTDIKFNEITNFQLSALYIINSNQILIEQSIFNNIQSLGSAPALTIEQCKQVNLYQNKFEGNIAQQDSGAVYFISSDDIVLTKNTFTNNISNEGLGGCLVIEKSTISNLESNTFDQNQSIKQSAGSIYCLNGQIFNLVSNLFSDNSAINGSGGALFLNNCDVLLMKDNTFYQNSAFIGGAIRYQILKPFAIFNSTITQLKKINSFQRNKCISYGKDIGSYPTILDVKNSFDDDKYQQNAIVENVQSGYQAQSPILLRFIDEEMREITFANFTQQSQVIKQIQDEFLLYILQADSLSDKDNIGLLGDLKQAYSQKDFAFKFDLSYSFKPESESFIKIKSTQNLPQFTNQDQKVNSIAFEIPILVKFRKCQKGEVLQQSGAYTICYTCEQGFYSMVDPYQSQDITCKRCPVGSIACNSNQIFLENGYWRLNEESDILVPCSSNPLACKPEQQNITKNGCTEGHVGPLCEECDVRGEVWGAQYAQISELDCLSCKKFSNITNLSLFIFIFLFILTQIFGKSYKQVTLTKRYILAVYLSKIGLISPNIERTQTVEASLMKILLNYFQFVMIVNSLDISLPIYFAAFNLSGGDTSQQTINRIDCGLFAYQTEMPNYVVRVLWVNSQPLILFIFLEFMSQFTIQKTQVSAQRQTLYTNLIIVFSFFQPSIVKVLSQSFSCRQIGDSSFILSDLKERCLTENHMFYFYTVLLPLGIFWIFFGPLFLFYRMSHYKNQMNSIKIIYRYGYLYQVNILIFNKLFIHSNLQHLKSLSSIKYQFYS